MRLSVSGQSVSQSHIFDIKKTEVSVRLEVRGRASLAQLNILKSFPSQHIRNTLSTRAFESLKYEPGHF